MAVQETYTDPEVARFRAMVAGKVDGLRELSGRTAALLHAARGGDEAARSAALVELDQLQGGAEAIWQGLLFEIEAAAADALRVRGATREDDRGLTLDQAWAGCRAQLDRAEGEGALLTAIRRLADQAVAEGSPDRIHLLRDRLPEYFAARGHAAAAAEAVARVDEAHAAALPPGPRAALLARAGLSRGWPRILSGFNLARAELTGGEPLKRLPGYEPDEWVSVNAAMNGER